MRPSNAIARLHPVGVIPISLANSAALAGSFGCPATASARWSARPTASARRSSSRRRWAATTASGAIWSTIASTTSSWCRRRRCSFSIISRSGKLEPAMAADVVRGVAGGVPGEQHGAARRRDGRDAGPLQSRATSTWPARSSASSTSPISRTNRASSEGDAIIGLPSIGLHTNGYTLARALIAPEEYAQPFGDTTFGDALLAAHPSYCEGSARDPKGRRRESDGAHHRRRLDRQRAAHAAAHRAGPCSSNRAGPYRRSWPNSCGAAISDTKNATARLNMGVGYTLIVPFMDAAKAIAAVPSATVVGFVSPRQPDGPAVVVHPART